MSPIVVLTLLLATVSVSAKKDKIPGPGLEDFLPFLAAGGGEKPGDISKAPPQVAAMLPMGSL